MLSNQNQSWNGEKLENRTMFNTDFQYQTLWFLVYEFLIPTICAVGIFGNFMAVALIESSDHLKKLQSNIFLSILAVFSNVFLFTLLLIWLEPLIDNLHVYNSPNVLGCKILTYLAHCADFACVWLIVLVTIDRAMVLQWAEKRTYIYSIVNARKISIILIFVALLFNTWSLMVATPLSPYIGVWYCNVPDHHIDLYVVFNTMETIIGIIVPSILIIIANGVTVYKLRTYTQNNLLCTPTVRFKQSGSQTNLGTKETNVNTHGQGHPTESLLTMSVSRAASPEQDEVADKSQVFIYHNLGDMKKSGRRIVRSSDLHLLKTMLVLTTIFLVLNFPSYLCRLFLSETGSFVFSILWQLSYMLYYCHHAVMFYLYVFNSKRMRKELKPAAVKLLECYCLKTVPDFGHDTR